MCKCAKHGHMMDIRQHTAGMNADEDDNNNDYNHHHDYDDSNVNNDDNIGNDYNDNNDNNFGDDDNGEDLHVQTIHSDGTVNGKQQHLQRQRATATSPRFELARTTTGSRHQPRA